MSQWQLDQQRQDTRDRLNGERMRNLAEAQRLADERNHKNDTASSRRRW